MTKFTCVDLLAGCGGRSIGFEQTGLSPLLFNEINPSAAEASSINEHGIELKAQFRKTLHDRAIRPDNGWTTQLGRGLDIHHPPEDWLEIGADDLDLRPLRETSITYVRTGKK